MSVSRTELESMTRDELVETVIQLQERVEDVENTLGNTAQPIDVAALRLLLTQLSPEGFDDEAHDAPVQRAKSVIDRLESIDERLASVESDVAAVRTIGSDRTSKEEKIAQIVTYASNQQTRSTTRTTVTPKAVKGVTGVSRRYAYDLCEEMIEQYDWALDPTELSQSIEQSGRKAGVTIDFELLHTDPPSVNKFTTGDCSQGGSE